MVRDRNPELYRLEALREARRRWYPLFTIVGANNPLPEEAEVVSSLDALADTWGKYVVDLRGVEPSIPPSLLLQLADLLEANPRIALARTGGDPPLTIIRRWSLHDPGAEPAGEVVLDDLTSGLPPPGAGSMPRPGWFVPEAGLEPGVTIQRQRPEESAVIPDPGRW